MMDQIDKKILMLLQENDKHSYEQLAKKLELAPSTVHSRVKKLKDSGIIKSFSAIVDTAKVGYPTISWLGLTVDPLKISEIAKKLSRYPEVQLVASCSGDHDLVVQLIAKDMKSLWRFINEKIKTIQGVTSKMDVSGFIDVWKSTHKVEL
ncbi:MAG: Lrp/AsnC family transcriptional regulator [Promethearchaeota archaeon]|nr:MAG: Lrp/AsnC family transcriptional regulator [Candidatus Lokiarchaeota archaeon]